MTAARWAQPKECPVVDKRVAGMRYLRGSFQEGEAGQKEVAEGGEVRTHLPTTRALAGCFALQRAR